MGMMRANRHVRHTRAAGWATVLLFLLSVLPGCRPAAGLPAALNDADGSEYAIYLTNPFDETGWRAIEGQTLDDRPIDLPTGITTLATEGAIAVGAEYLAGRAHADPRQTWVIVYDWPAGTERHRFHPPVGGIAAGLSADGRRLLWQPFPVEANYPPPVDWYVLATTDGSTVAHIYDEEGACFRQSLLADRTGEQFYCLSDPSPGEGGSTIGLDAIRMVKYRPSLTGSLLSGGSPAAELVVPDALIGTEPVRSDAFHLKMYEPALALAPDGHRLAVVHAESDKITLVNAQDMTLENTITLSPAADVGDWLGLAARTAQAKGEIEGVIRHAAFSADSRQLYVFSQVRLPNGEEPPAERGLWRVDLSSGQVAARALGEYQIQWLLPAPDGTLFAFGTSDADIHPHEIRETSPSTLWRLDGQTLRILAAHDFTGYRAGRLTAGAP